MTPDLTTTLCTTCGLCCDGTLFADVELSGPAESTRVEFLGLRIEEDDADRDLMALPCAALRGKRCGVYAHRPKCCRTFECRLLQDARRGTVSVTQASALIAEALGRVKRAKVLLARLGQRDAELPLAERSAEVFAAGPGVDPKANERRRELAATMSALQKLIRKRFLGGDPAPERL
jgi:hypothetical protein